MNQYQAPEPQEWLNCPFCGQFPEAADGTVDGLIWLRCSVGCTALMKLDQWNNRAPTRAAEGVREAQCPTKDFTIERVFGKDCEFTVRPDLPCNPQLFGEWLANVLGKALAAGPSPEEKP